MSPKLHRILIAGCALVGCLHGPRAASLLLRDGSLERAEAQALRAAAEEAAARASLLAGQVPVMSFTALLGTDSTAPGS